MKEYIVSVDDDDMDYEEVFVAHIRKQTELIRCKDCKYGVYETYGEYGHYCSLDRYVETGEEFCSSAEPKDNEE